LSLLVSSKDKVGSGVGGVGGVEMARWLRAKKLRKVGQWSLVPDPTDYMAF
jgi:hypothetical protein